MTAGSGSALFGTAPDLPRTYYYEVVLLETPVAGFIDPGALPTSLHCEVRPIARLR